MPPKNPTYMGQLITSFLGMMVRGELQGVAQDAGEEAIEVAVRNIRKRFPRPVLIVFREVLNRAIGDEPIDSAGKDGDVIDVECEVVDR